MTHSSTSLSTGARPALRRRHLWLAPCLLLAGFSLLLPSPAPAGPVPIVLPYYLNPCLDQNADGIEDYLTELPDLTVDLYVVFDALTWNPVTARAQVQAILTARGSSTTIVYVGQWSPYLFLHNARFDEMKTPSLELRDILNLKSVVGLRAFQRFQLRYTVSGSVEPIEDPPVGAAPNPAPLPLPVAPAVLLYFVDSGVDGTDQYWGIDAPNEDPLLPKQAHDPADLSLIRHGTYVERVAFQTLAMSSAPVPVATARYADVRVAVGPNGETTTLELTRGFDAVVAHIQSELAQGRHSSPVVNVSYDTDGPIANHDIIYPGPGGRLGVRDGDVPIAALGGPPANAGGIVQSPRAPYPHPWSPQGNPCLTELFDNVYRILSDTYGAVIVVGAGNDGLVAPFSINEVALSVHATIVAAATDPVTDLPADYSNFGTAPAGLPQNGHPDLAAPGLAPAPGFDYRLQGTSISTALCSAMGGALLLRSPALSPRTVLAQLIAAGVRIPPQGERWYGDARVEPAGLLRPGFAPAGPQLSGRPPTLVFPGSAERFVVPGGPDQPVTVRIFSVAGRLVRTLADGRPTRGWQEIGFDGRGDDGSALPGGFYFVRSSNVGGSSVTKLLIRR